MSASRFVPRPGRSLGPLRRRRGAAPCAARAAGGFTLVEVLLVLAILAILAAAALPIYIDHLRRGWRVEGRAALIDELQRQERLFTLHGAYQPALLRADADVPAGARYTLQAGPCEGMADTLSCLRLTATPRQPDPAVQAIWVESSGLKGCTGSDKNRCWS